MNADEARELLEKKRREQRILQEEKNKQAKEEIQKRTESRIKVDIEAIQSEILKAIDKFKSCVYRNTMDHTFNAKQHYNEIKDHFENLGYEVSLVRPDYNYERVKSIYDPDFYSGYYIIEIRWEK